MRLYLAAKEAGFSSSAICMSFILMSFVLERRSNKNRTGESRNSSATSATASSINHPSIGNSVVDFDNSIIYLQRTMGNRQVNKLMHHNSKSNDFIGSGIIQPKLKISQPGDIYEQEADRVAEQVMRMLSVDNSIIPAIPKNGKKIDGKCSPCERKQHKVDEVEENLNISRKPSTLSNFEASDEITNGINNIRSCGGSLLDSDTKQLMESRFGYDFSKVRIHAGERAARSAASINALAYTVGNDIIFGDGQYRPSTLKGKALLAHELTHVIQHTSYTQRSVKVQNVSTKEMIHRRSPAEDAADYDEAISLARFGETKGPKKASLISLEDRPKKASGFSFEDFYWYRVARDLNAFNLDDIRARLGKLSQEEIDKIRQAAIGSNDLGPESAAAIETRVALQARRDAADLSLAISEAISSQPDWDRLARDLNALNIQEMGVKIFEIKKKLNETGVGDREVYANLQKAAFEDTKKLGLGKGSNVYLEASRYLAFVEGQTPSSFDKIKDILINSPTGIEALTIKNVRGVNVEFKSSSESGDPRTKGSYYLEDSNTIILDTDNDIKRLALIFVHEMNHAEYAWAKKTAKVNALSRSAFIEEKLNEEVESDIKRITAKLELEKSIVHISLTPASNIEAELLKDYKEATDKAKANNPTIGDNELKSIGIEAMRPRLMRYYKFEAIRAGENVRYSDFYADEWDRAHRVK
jgi:hypothetical protein